MNNVMTLKQNLLFLNLLLKHEVDHDMDCDGILYLIVDYEESKNLIQELICDGEAFNEYVEEYKEDDIEGIPTIDICQLWSDVCDKFDTEIWYTAKSNKFYILRWYHRLYSKYSEKKRDVKYKIEHFKNRFKSIKMQIKYKRNLKKRLKFLSKQFPDGIN